MDNYFNYFTEIEEFFWKKRGSVMLLSTLDWALIDSWKQAEIPLRTVLQGIERAFEKYDARRNKTRKVNSLAYCHQEVLAAAEEQDRATLHHPSSPDAFPREAVTRFLQTNADALAKAAAQFQSQSRPESAATVSALAASIREMAGTITSDAPLDLENMERRLTVLEDKLFATLTAAADETEMVGIRQEMDRALAPFRSKMATEQLMLVEKQFLERRLLEKSGLPRLSLFYL